MGLEYKFVEVAPVTDDSYYQTEYAELSERLKAVAGENYDKPIYVRADGGAPYESVARVMAKLSNSGFAKINLITDTAAPESRAR